VSRTRDAADALLPKGRAWTRLRATTLGRLLDAICASFERIETRAEDLVAEALPTTATETLAVWEYLVGVGGGASLSARRAAVAACIVPPEDMSLAALVADAAAIGYAITPTEHALFRAGASAADDPVRAEAWVHTLDISVAHGLDDVGLRNLIADRTHAHQLVRMQWTGTPI
jgi:uncharacterized protein YmfQ (DUF2313 family)